MNQTYNILEACRVLGIINVAIASSETVLGLPFYPHFPESFPVTETVERPESSYSLAKLMGEKMYGRPSRSYRTASADRIQVGAALQMEPLCQDC
jgi:nucleoside-diphosphate-sugar epimerase